ncbi:MAG TPA: kelch repeat-containing protein [Bacteroidia bacterium]|jgi:N-acetylneuraminic acid mutarotase
MKKLSFLFFLFSSLSGVAQNTWLQKASIPTNPRQFATGFSIGTKAYLGSGIQLPSNYMNDFWVWDQGTNTWTQKANIPGVSRYGAASFAIGNKGYWGTGYNGGVRYSDFYEYDPAANTWTQKANFGGGIREGVAMFSIGGKGYFACGYDPANYNDLWEYDPGNNSWTQKQNFPGTARQWPTGIAIGNKGYVGLGNDGADKNDWYEYDPLNNTWTQKANYTGAARYEASGFSVLNYGYVGLGRSSSTPHTDFYQYDPANDTWQAIASLPSSARWASVGFGVGNYGYISTGYSGSVELTDLWEYSPNCTVPAQPGSINGPNPVCSGTSNTYSISPVPGATSYTWTLPGGWSGSSSSTSITTTAGINGGVISVTANNPCGTSPSQIFSVTVNPSPVISAASTDYDICYGETTTIVANGGNAYTWQPGNMTGFLLNVTPNATTTYTVTGTNSYGCTGTATVSISVNQLPNVTLNLSPDTVCSNSAPVVLSGGSPSGGNYSGLAVAGNTFFPSIGPGTYAITYTYTNSYGCTNSDTANMTVFTCTGITEAGNGNDLNVFPDPFVDELNLVVNEQCRVEIFNSIGEEVYGTTATPGSNKIFCSNLKPGIYFIVATSVDATYSRKVIKE